MMPEPKPIVAAGEILLVKISGGKSQKMVETAFVDQFESHEGPAVCGGTSPTVLPYPVSSRCLQPHFLSP